MTAAVEVKAAVAVTTTVVVKAAVVVTTTVEVVATGRKGETWR
jgi:hypothetical protein